MQDEDLLGGENLSLAAEREFVHAGIHGQRSTVESVRQRFVVDRHLHVDPRIAVVPCHERHDGGNVGFQLRVARPALLSNEAAARRVRAREEQIARLPQPAGLLDLERRAVRAGAVASLGFPLDGLGGARRREEKAGSQGAERKGATSETVWKHERILLS